MPNRHRQHSASFFAKERILQHSCSLISRVHCKMILKTPQDYLLRIKEEFWGQFINFQDPFKKKLKSKDFLLFCNYNLPKCITFFCLHVPRKKIFNLICCHSSLSKSIHFKNVSISCVIKSITESNFQCVAASSKLIMILYVFLYDQFSKKKEGGISH